MRLGIIAIALLFLASCGGQPSSDHDAALRALDAAYVDGWKKQSAEAQEKAVMALFTNDAVIMPGGGAEPGNGIRAVRSFWFPEDSPMTNVNRFDHDITNISADGALGVVSGRYRLEFEYGGESYAREGNYLFVAENQARGWRISQMIWNDSALDE